MRDQTPTMRGFKWTSTPGKIPAELGDGWCLRDAMCQLFGWSIGSKEWRAFIECPSAYDTERLCDHLGLEWYDPLHPPHIPLLQARVEHPGAFVYVSGLWQLSHVIYEPHLRYPRWLPPAYLDVDPNWELLRCFVDVRQSPHPLL
jgi:hypothetical protein